MIHGIYIIKSHGHFCFLTHEIMEFASDVPLDDPAGSPDPPTG